MAEQLTHPFKAILVLLVTVIFSPDLAAQQVRILYYSSTPEIIRGGERPGLAHVATVVRKAREQNDNVLFIHGGASLGPSVLGALDSGAHMIDVLNMLEPDLMAVGKREFSYTEDQFTLRALSAGFPFIASNLLQKNKDVSPEGIEPNLLVEMDGIKIGFVALTSPNMIVQYGAQKITAVPTDKAVRQNVAELKASGADAIVLLADTDFDDLSLYTADGTVDAILYAHNFVSPVSADAGGHIIKDGALDGRLIDLTLEKVPAKSGYKIQSELKSIDLHFQEKDPELQSVIQSYADRLELLLSQEIGITTSDFNTMEDQVRTGESAFGNLVADAVRAATHADVAILNSGGIRGNRYYRKGQMLTREDIQMELPFNNTVELFEVTGEQLLEALEWGIGCRDEMDGCFLQVSNMNVIYDLSRPKGARITTLLINDVPVVRSKTYRLGTLNFIAAGGDGFTMLKESHRLTEPGSGKLLWEVVATYLKSLPKIQPKIEGRLVINKATK